MRIVFLILMSVMFLASNGQSYDNKPVNNKFTMSTLVFDQKEFGNRFSVLTYSEYDYDYYAVDLTKLADRFERVYFMNLTYQDKRLINLDPALENPQIWFKAYHQYTESEITCLFTDLKEKTGQAGRDMSAQEKTAWMTKNDKFKKNIAHE